MKLVKKIKELEKALSLYRASNKNIGLVPTMGALHDGHLSLIRRSVRSTDVTVVSIFVNPIQFGPGEDLDKYPRDLKKDMKLSKAAGADIVFAPEIPEMIGTDLLTFVDVRMLGDNLCGARRPGHFRGVCTIVAKLFNIVKPDKAFFGKKDIQQLYIIKKMTKDLNFDIDIVPCDIVREKSGLAMSSRNVYLSAAEREDAAIIPRSFTAATKRIEAGEKRSEVIVRSMYDMLSTVKNLKIDYIKIVDDKLEDAAKIDKGCILAVAVYFGKTRLIDNHIIGEKICF